jgi:hypothetical protein
MCKGRCFCHYAAALLPVGVRHVCGAPYLVLEDLTAQYSQPCILDVKVRTWAAAAAPDLACHCNVGSASSPWCCDLFMWWARLHITQRALDIVFQRLLI